MPSPNPSRKPIVAAVILSILTLFSPAWAATGTLMPAAYQTVLDTSGNPINNAKVCTYLAGTTTQVATYSDVTLATPNANPIRTDSAGRYGPVYLTPGQSYKFVFQDASGTVGTCDGATIRTVDNVAAVPSTSSTLDVIGTAGEALTAGQVVYLSDGSGAKAAGQWFKADSTNPYSSSAAVSIGITPVSIANGATGTIRLAGSINGLTSLVIGSTYYASTAGTLTTTQPPYGREIGIADTTTSMVLAVNNDGSIPINNTLTTTGTVTALAIPSSRVGTVLLYLNNASLLTVQGIATAPVGQRLILVSNGAGQVDFVHQSGSASAANRLINQATGNVTSLAPGTGSAEYVYDATNRWRLVTHNQGSAIVYTPTWSGSGTPPTIGNGSLSGTYFLRGQIITYHISLTFGTTTSVAAATTFTFTVPYAADSFGPQGPLILMTDASAGSIYPGTGVNISTSAFQVITTASPGVAAAAAAPFAWAVSDTLTVNGSYFVP